MRKPWGPKVPLPVIYLAHVNLRSWIMYVRSSIRNNMYLVSESLERLNFLAFFTMFVCFLFLLLVLLLCFLLH